MYVLLYKPVPSEPKNQRHAWQCPMSTDQPSQIYFLVGSVRSGTTMLRLMLDHHPQICCFGEFEYAVQPLEVSKAGKPPNKGDYHQWLTAERRFVAHNLTINHEVGYPELVRSFVQQMHERSGKPVTGATVHWGFEHLTKIWPDARFIHLVRDGRDVAKSVVQMGWAGNVWTAAETWIGAEKAWDRMAPTLKPCQAIELKQEDLVSQPEFHLTRLCKFLGTEFDPAMMAYHLDTTYDAPDATLINQWKRRLPASQIQLLEARMGSLLEERGYELSGHPPRTLGLLTRAKLNFQDKFARNRHRIRRYGFRLWLQEKAARRFGSQAERLRLQQQINTIDQQYLK